MFVQRSETYFHDKKKRRDVNNKCTKSEQIVHAGALQYCAGAMWCVIRPHKGRLAAGRVE